MPGFGEPAQLTGEVFVQGNEMSSALEVDCEIHLRHLIQEVTHVVSFKELYQVGEFPRSGQPSRLTSGHISAFLWQPYLGH